MEGKTMTKQIRTIGVLTSGGDAPGMNAAIRAVVRTALGNGVKVRGIRRGYSGLLNEDIIDMTARDVSDTIQRGGTILQTGSAKNTAIALSVKNSGRTKIKGISRMILRRTARNRDVFAFPSAMNVC